MPYQSLSPYTSELLQTYPDATDAEIEAALERAERAYAAWRATPVARRAAVLARAAELMGERKEALSRLAVLEMGKLIGDARGEIDLTASIIAYYADNAERLLADRRLDAKGGGEALVRMAPLGPLLGIQPWNFPYHQVARFAAPNIAAGNVILLKHAQNVPQCALAIADLFRDAGLPEGAYQNLFAATERIAGVIADDRVRGVSLTGSERAGAAVGSEAGKAMKKAVLELGGSDPFIVLDDADLDAAVDRAVWGRMATTGQSCACAKRFIVMEPVADAFLERFVARLGSLRVGDPMDEATQLGPLCSVKAADGFVDAVKQSAAQGARVLLGGERIDRPGAFMQATVVTDLKPGMPCHDQEMFAPVAGFWRVGDEEEALRVANGSQYGLDGAIFTRDLDRGRRFADRVESGMVWINHPTWSAADLPFGGVKRSGFGRELSDLGIQEFVKHKLIRTLPSGVPI